MTVQYDFSKPMIEEVMIDLADNFFSSRKELDEMTDIFQSCLCMFREKELVVSERAGFLNWLLIRKDAAEEFYESLGMNSPDPLLSAESRLPDDKIIPEKIPFAFTPKGKFIKLVLRAYHDLHKAADEYMNGYPGDSDTCDVYYRMMLKMAMLINEKIRRINQGLAPSAVIGFARRFNPEAMGKEQIAGATLDGYDFSIDSKLAYQILDPDSLQFKSYPELPEPGTVLSEIISFCEKNYAENKEEIGKRIADVKRRIRVASNSACFLRK